MPPPPLDAKQRQHLKESYDFYKFSDELAETGEQLGWASIVLFYSALHLVQAYSIKKGAALHNHDDRLSFVANQLRPIYGEYDRLFQLSKRARYHCAPPTMRNLKAYHDEDYMSIVDELKTRSFSWDLLGQADDT